MILLAFLGCPVPQLPHDGDTPEFPLEGGHTVPCEACHGNRSGCNGPPKALPSGCVNCHAQEDLPPGHTASTACEGCHVSLGWAVGVTPGTDTGTGPTDTGPADTGPADTDTGFDHGSLAEDQQCQACHDEGASVPFRPPGHNPGADCGPCHQTTGWADSPIQHPAPTPHGGSVVACSDCHPSGPPAVDCVTCHADDKLTPSHNGFGPSSDPANSGGCLRAGCHPDATSPF